MMAHLYISLHQTPKAPYRVWANGDLVAECRLRAFLTLSWLSVQTQW